MWLANFRFTQVRPGLIPIGPLVCRHPHDRNRAHVPVLPRGPWNGFRRPLRCFRDRETGFCGLPNIGTKDADLWRFRVGFPPAFPSPHIAASIFSIRRAPCSIGRSRLLIVDTGVSSSLRMFSWAWLAAGLWSVRPSKYKGARASALWHSNCSKRPQERRESLSRGTKRAVACAGESLL